MSRAKLIVPEPDEDWADTNYETILRAWLNSNPEQADRANGRTTGYYTFAKALRFRAGSYGGYNRWREWLSDLALGVEPEVVWANPVKWAGQAFVPLIHFADNEGIIGPQTSANLALDFAAFADKVHGDSTHDEYDVERYDMWRAAFELAADDGLVQFH